MAIILTNRRSFLIGLAAGITAPAIITTPGLLMPVKKVVLPVIFTGSAAGRILTIKDTVNGSLKIGDLISGKGIAEGTRIVAQVSDSTYVLDKFQYPGEWFDRFWPRLQAA